MSSECIVAIERSSCTNYFFRENKPKQLLVSPSQALRKCLNAFPFFCFGRDAGGLSRGNFSEFKRHSKIYLSRPLFLY